MLRINAAQGPLAGVVLRLKFSAIPSVVHPSPGIAAMSLVPDSTRHSTRSRGAALALVEIECLANEMAALMRMGVPLGAGLREIAPSMRGGLRHFVKSLAGKIESGKDLSAALHEERQRLPAFFRAVVDAGIRGGDPAIALKSIAEMARRIEEHRRLEMHALLYPLLIGLAATGLIYLSILYILPTQVELYSSDTVPWPLVWAQSASTFMRTYWWAIPLGLILAWLAIWMRPVDWKSTSNRSSWLGVGTIPIQRNILMASRWSMMLEVLTLLLSRRMPLDESLRLAAAVALSHRGCANVDAAAMRLRNGERLTESDYLGVGFPRAIASALATPRPPGAFLQALSQLENEYRWRVADLRRRFNGPWLTVFSVSIAGLFVLIYVIVVVLPLAQVYFDVVNSRV